MATAEGVACVACGETDELLQCPTCTSRLSNKGVSAAICPKCLADGSILEAVGKIQSGSSSGSPAFLCMPCVIYNKRREEEQLLAAVGGPSPTDVLKTIAKSAPWYLTIRQASDEEKLNALTKLKRRLDFTSTSRELANGLANYDPMSALLLQNLASSGSNPICMQAMDAFVASKCPSVKYKDLLLPERGGSLEKARRHFQEQLGNPDKLVAALASERDFLCEYVEKQVTPPQKKGAKHSLAALEIPAHGLVWLRFIFKSLSQRIKRAAARNDAANLLVKCWYADHLMVAHSMVQQYFVQTAASSVRHPLPLPSHMTGDVQSNKRAKLDNNTKGRGKQTPALPKYKPMGQDKPNKDSLAAGSIPSSIKRLLKDNLTVAQANSAMRAAFDLDKKASYLVFSMFCKNCYAAGRGWVQHKLSVCRKSHPCSLECSKCNNGSIHWLEECPRK